MLKVDTSKNKGKVSLYLRIKDVATTLLLMRDWAKRIDETLFPPECSHAANTMMNDLRAILADTTKSETERLAELAVRLGQGKFRDDLQREFGNACAATGLTALPVLRASHIVPWRSDEAERLNPKNGLLLSANLDALFDRYMITFDPEGKLKISEFVTKRDQERLGPLPNLQSTPCDARAAFLRRHNAEFERRERQRFADVKASE
ncbi:hypothetical protein WM06_33125 [Burkholderia cepacia]|nr:hypothetical protein WM06_33125 [Burkholderia cepacia]